MKLCFDELETPLGLIRWVARDERLCAVAFGDGWAHAEAGLKRRLGGPFSPARAPDHAFTRALRAYFAGEVTALDGLPVEPDGTPFQREVWKALREIPAGRTWSYGELAARVGRTRTAARAVGSANAANPVALVIPCHRVIRSDADLCGYAFGVERKRWLLDHEARAVAGRAA